MKDKINQDIQIGDKIVVAVGGHLSTYNISHLYNHSGTVIISCGRIARSRFHVIKVQEKDDA